MALNDFLLDSDFATLKNDTQTNTLSVSLVSGTNYDPANPILGTATLDVGTVNAGIRSRGNSSKYSSRWTVGTTLYSDILVRIPSLGVNFTQTLYCYLDRISPTTVRLLVGTDGSSGAPTHQVFENQTITFVFSTFLSPFDN